MVAGLAAAAPDTNTDAGVKLTWTAPSNAANIANFEIQHCASSSCTNAVSGGTPGAATTAHTVTGLTRNTQYHFRIRAVAASNSDYQDSDWSATVSRTTAKTPLTTVAGLTAAAPNTDGHSSANLNWTGPSTTTNIANFEIQHCASSACSSPVSGGTPGAAVTAHTVTGLTRNTAYHFRIRAVAQANSDYSDSAWSTTTGSLTTAKEPLPKVSKPSAAYAGWPQPVGTLTVAWSQVIQNELDKYRLEVCSNRECSSTVSTHDVAGLEYEHNCGTSTTCHYRVRALAKSGTGYTDGPPSDVLSVTTP